MKTVKNLKIIEKCFFCGKKHIDYGTHRTYDLDDLARKTSYELLMIILYDMKKFIHEHEKTQTLWTAVTCFCKFSIFEADDACPSCGDNHHSELHHSIFGGILKLIDNHSSLHAIDEFLDRIQKKLWSEHEKVLAKVNMENTRIKRKI